MLKPKRGTDDQPAKSLRIALVDYQLRRPMPHTRNPCKHRVLKGGYCCISYTEKIADRLIQKGRKPL
jgi:hypothetical protein